MKIKKYFLLLAAGSVSIIALLYGVSPRWFAATLLGMDQLNVNFAHVLRAVMGLYLALTLFWLYSAFSDTLRTTAVLTVIIFNAGLVGGRLISFVVDGKPATTLVVYCFLEVALFLAAAWVYKRPD